MQKIFDTFLYYDEDLMLNLRMNILNKFINHFVILECNYDFNGNYKGYNLKLTTLINLKIKLFILN